MRNFLDTVKTADAVLILSPINRRYFTQFASTAGMLLMTKEKSYFLTDSRYILDATAAIPECEVIETTMQKTYFDVIVPIIKEQGIKTIGIEFDRVTINEFEGLKKAFGVDFVDISKEVILARNIKSEFELDKMRKAQVIGDKAFTEILKFIKEGVSEKEIAAKLVSVMYELGADGISFPPIVASGANGASPHAKPSDKKVEKGEFITMDFGCTLGGYCSDMTRTIALGEPTDEMKEMYNLVLKVQEAGIKLAKAGVKGNDIHDLAVKMYEDAGVSKYFGHGFGHGIGMEVHEGFGAGPGPRGENILGENMMISAEPGLYFEGRFGLRIEDILILTKDGNENITFSPKELIVL